MRRYDIDWLRVIALGLLILYHVVVAFQPWAKATIFFIQNEQTLEDLWPLMAMLNVWRIPILFLVSGMGVCFAMKRRNWKALLKDRTLRILVPFIFGLFCICPISVFLAMEYYDQSAVYVPNPGHLWFLANIFLYVVLLLPLLSYLNYRPDNIVLRFLGKAFRHPAGLYLFALPIMLEALLVQPKFFSLYVGTPHGFWLGLVCFLSGFLFVSAQESFWQAIKRFRTVALSLAFLLYLARFLVFELKGPGVLTAFESTNWMLAILGYGSTYLNKPSRLLAYASKAVYPVYIVHMPIQYFVSFYLLPLSFPVSIKLVMLLSATFGGSQLLYELVIKRITLIRPLFGMKLHATSI